ncbi:nuclease-related domain-containing protein [Lysinibacillus sp. NPDC048646]|uniref:nuclease-related domain-containing protein n=1 Tax=Lysinibacillus sp. NPDC048646 TaxID=3390574 RepID=UPI003D019603
MKKAIGKGKKRCYSRGKKGGIRLILKPFEETKMVYGLRALVQRLEKNHSHYNKIIQDLQQLEAGDLGEKRIMEQLQKMASSNEIYILHNITFTTPMPIQLDIVVITPYDVIIIESKNIRGRIDLKCRPRRMVRTLENGDKHIFNHPEIQLEEYVLGLDTFFKQQQLEIGVTGVIVFPFNNADIHYEDGKFPVLMMRELIYFLRQHILNKQSQREIMSVEIANLLLTHHHEYRYPPLCTYYKIDPQAILRGIYCRHCSQSKLIRLKKNWFCPLCKTYDKVAHHQALNDYRLLIGNQINTEAARHFLEISNRHIAKRILQDYCKKKEGHNNQMMYQL